MKKSILIVVILVSSMAPASAQSCLPEGITFSTQAQIDSFQFNYPNCTEIEGYVGIYGSGDISDLSGLSVLTSIGGYLEISGNIALTSLTGLDNVTSIGSSVWINHTHELSSLTGLDNLTSIGGDLVISDNDALTNLAGLNNLTSLGGDLYINNNEGLINLDGLNNLETVSILNLSISYNNNLSSCDAQAICTYLSSPGGVVIVRDNAPGCNNIEEIASDCDITLPCLPFGNYYFTSQSQIDDFQSNFPGCTELKGDVLIKGNDIIDLSGFNVLTSIDGNLSVYGNEKLASLTGLDHITTISGNLQIGKWPDTLDNQSLNSLSGLDNLASIGGNLRIENNTVLSSLMGINNLTSINGNLEIGLNEMLVSLEGLDNLTSIGGKLVIESNSVLSNLLGLNRLTSVGGNLSVCNNSAMTSLLGLDSLTFIGGSLYIGDFYDETRGNPSLASLTGLEGLSDINGYTIEIGGNDNLIDLTGLNNLNSIDGRLAIGGNDGLTDLTGLNNLVSIAESLVIDRNDALTSLTGLENLNSVRGLNIGFSGGNPSLESLTALSNVTSLYGNLEVVDNSALPSLAGLENLTFVASNLILEGNEALTDITAIENIDGHSINDLTISNNSSLSSCAVQSFCTYLSAPAGKVSIHNNAAGCNNPGEIANECGFTMPCLPEGDYYFTSQAEVDSFMYWYPGCTELEGHVFISGSDIIDLNGLSVVTSIEYDLYISGNDALVSLSGLENITSPIRHLLIGNDWWPYTFTAGNPSLADLSGLDNLVSIESLSINDNDALINLSGLENIDTIRYLVIAENQLLTSLTGLGNVNHLAPWGIRIDNNDALTNLSGLEGIDTTTSLSIANNDGLISLTGLDNLTTIWGSYSDLNIHNNDALINLTGLESLTSIYAYGMYSMGMISIRDNDALISLTGIENIKAESILQLIVQQNPYLSTCDVLSVCDFLDRPWSWVAIDSNAVGCNSPEEVLEACTFGIVERTSEEQCIVYPNPCSGTAHLRYSISDIRYSKLELYSMQGIMIRTLLDQMQQPGEYELEFDVSDLPGGLYFIRIQAGDVQATVKLVVIH